MCVTWTADPKTHVEAKERGGNVQYSEHLWKAVEALIGPCIALVMMISMGLSCDDRSIDCAPASLLSNLAGHHRDSHLLTAPPCGPTLLALGSTNSLL